MTTGGTVVRSSPAHTVTPDPTGRSGPARWVAEHLPSVLAVVVFAGCLLRVRQRWFIPGNGGFGYTTRVVQSTLDGTAIAPNQYRPLMPWVDHWFAQGTGLALPTAILATDAILTVALLVLLHRLARRLDAPGLVLAAAAGWAWWLVKVEQWHPEIMLLTVVVTAATLQLTRRCPNPGVLLALGLLACGARTDYAAGLGVVVLAVGAHRRQAVTAGTGAVIAGAAVYATEKLVAAYPQAHYAVDVVQVPYNLTVGALALDAAFYGALLAVPALCAVARRGLPPLAFVSAWFLVEFAAVFVVGRTDEARIFMPLAPALGVAAAVSWRELRRDTSTSPL